MSRENKLCVFDISRMALHNGPGIRTMVHFKGCNLDCKWCSTPESKEFVPQLAYFERRCIGCNYCVNACKIGAIRSSGNKIEIDWDRCTHCMKCVETCCSTALSAVGEYYTAEELYKIIIRDKNLYHRSGGGVTFSGGEVLMHVNNTFVHLLGMLNEAGISIGLDTAGCVGRDTLNKVLPYTDFFLWDIKLIDDDLHRKYTGKSNRVILDNIHYLDECGKDLYIRCPVITGVNDNDAYFEKLLTLAKQLQSVKEIHLLPFHRLGEARYEKIGMKNPYEGMGDVSREYLAEKMETFMKEGIHARIIG